MFTKLINNVAAIWLRQFLVSTIVERAIEKLTIFNIAEVHYTVTETGV